MSRPSVATALGLAEDVLRGEDTYSRMEADAAAAVLADLREVLADPAWPDALWLFGMGATAFIGRSGTEAAADLMTRLSVLLSVDGSPLAGSTEAGE